MKAVQSENKWTCAAMGSSEVAVVGHPTDVWLFRISMNLSSASASVVSHSPGEFHLIILLEAEPSLWFLELYKRGRYPFPWVVVLRGAPRNT